ncbi:unnamed protein product [Withania somnifera]
MEEQVVDYVLVPIGLFFMVAYHLWLLHRICKNPTRTVIGINSINRQLWVLLAVQTIRNNIMASTLLASTSIMLSSLIAVLVNSGSKGSFRVYGDKSELCLSIKLFCILVCFMVAFLFNVQSIRYYSHASILINVPNKKLDSPGATEYVGRTVNRGSYFWSLGLRVFYFSFPLFLWIFGPIPMFLCCFFLVLMLYFLDGSSDPGWVAPIDVVAQQTA